MREALRSSGVALLALACMLAAGCKNDRGVRATCTPGARVEIACGAECGLGSCTGDPVLEICEGDRSCTSGDLGSDDDSCGSRCPGLTITCPPGGVITISHRPFGSGAYTCDVQMRELGLPASPLVEGGDAGIR